MADKEINPTERKLSLDEMLKLADRIESWEYFPQRDTFFSFRPEQYIGEIDKVVIKVAQYGATPWGGWKRCIDASYGNLDLGHWPDGLGFDERVDRLFFHLLPEKIRKQGLDIVNKIKSSL